VQQNENECNITEKYIFSSKYEVILNKVSFSLVSEGSIFHLERKKCFNSSEYLHF
jgi:hypothetical protein